MVAVVVVRSSSYRLGAVDIPIFIYLLIYPCFTTATSALLPLTSDLSMPPALSSSVGIQALLQRTGYVLTDC